MSEKLSRRGLFRRVGGVAAAGAVAAVLPKEKPSLLALQRAEKMANPPLIVATGNIANSDIQIADRPMGITFLDEDYDKRLTTVLKPIYERTRHA